VRKPATAPLIIVKVDRAKVAYFLSGTQYDKGAVVDSCRKLVDRPSDCLKAFERRTALLFT
jgi:hypothetical protein